jgi:hypothetical protein
MTEICAEPLLNDRRLGKSCKRQCFRKQWGPDGFEKGWLGDPVPRIRESTPSFSLSIHSMRRVKEGSTRSGMSQPHKSTEVASWKAKCIGKHNAFRKTTATQFFEHFKPPSKIAAYPVNCNPQAALPPLALCPSVLVRSTTGHSWIVPAFALAVPGFVHPRMYSRWGDNNDSVRLVRIEEQKWSYPSLWRVSLQTWCLC